MSNLQKTKWSALLVVAGLVVSGHSAAKSVVVHDLDDYVMQQAEVLTERLHPLEVESGDGKFTVLVPSLYGFETGKSDLSRPMRDKIKSLSQFLNHYNESQIRVYGHTDSVGDFDYNVQLSAERAGAVYDQLVLNNVHPWRVEVVPESYEVPRCVEDTAEARECNRRVEIEVVFEPEVFR